MVTNIGAVCVQTYRIKKKTFGLKFHGRRHEKKLKQNFYMVNSYGSIEHFLVRYAISFVLLFFIPFFFLLNHISKEFATVQFKSKFNTE